MKFTAIYEMISYITVEVEAETYQEAYDNSDNGIPPELLKGFENNDFDLVRFEWTDEFGRFREHEL